MTIKIGSNIASIQAQRRLGEASTALSDIYERLSSGQRINKAGDDAAGLAIAADLNAKGRVFAQAIRNGNDGVSLLNIADSALESLSGVITRIRELAEQSANGTYSNKQREALDLEAQALSKEFTRISQSTSFNGIKIFDGSLGDGLRLQLGYGVDGSINSTVGGAIWAGSFNATLSYVSGGAVADSGLKLGDLNQDGILDMVFAGTGGVTTVQLGEGTGTFSPAANYISAIGKVNGVALEDLNGDGYLDLISTGLSGADGYTSVRLGTGTGSFGAETSYTAETKRSNVVTLGDLNGDGILDLVTGGESDATQGFATVRLGTGSGAFGASTSYATGNNRVYGVALGDLNGDKILDLVAAGNGGRTTVNFGSGDGTFGATATILIEGSVNESVALGDLNGDGTLDIVTSGYSGLTAYSQVRLGTGDGSFGASISFTHSGSIYAVTLGDISGDGILDIITAGIHYEGSPTNDFRNGITVRVGNGSGSFGAATTLGTGGAVFGSRALDLGDFNGDGTLDVVSIDNANIAVSVSSTKDGLASMIDFSLKTKADSLQAMGILQNAQNNLSKQRGVIGANQSRIAIAINNLTSSKENLAAAESIIRDADIAADAANLVRTQILQQAATAMLAQANQAPALALTLLR